MAVRRIAGGAISWRIFKPLTGLRWRGESALLRGFLIIGRIVNVRFGSFATDAFRARANQCPLCLQ
jgi:hypothetical protein